MILIRSSKRVQFPSVQLCFYSKIEVAIQNMSSLWFMYFAQGEVEDDFCVLDMECSWHCLCACMRMCPPHQERPLWANGALQNKSTHKVQFHLKTFMFQMDWGRRITSVKLLLLQRQYATYSSEKVWNHEPNAKLLCRYFYSNALFSW